MNLSLALVLSCFFAGSCSEKTERDDDVQADDDDADDDDADGSMVENPEATLAGNRYLLDLVSGEFTAPLKAHTIVSQYLADLQYVLTVESLSDSDGTVAINFEPSGSAPQPGVWANPTFAVGPLYDAEIESGEWTFVNVMLEGSFSSDGTSMNAMSVEGTLDARVLDGLVDPNADEGVACDFFAEAGLECEECPGEIGQFCLSFRKTSCVAELLTSG